MKWNPESPNANDLYSSSRVLYPILSHSMTIIYSARGPHEDQLLSSACNYHVTQQDRFHKKGLIKRPAIARRSIHLVLNEGTTLHETCTQPNRSAQPYSQSITLAHWRLCFFPLRSDLPVVGEHAS